MSVGVARVRSRRQSVAPGALGRSASSLNVSAAGAMTAPTATAEMPRAGVRDPGAGGGGAEPSSVEDPLDAERCRSAAEGPSPADAAAGGGAGAVRADVGAPRASAEADEALPVARELRDEHTTDDSPTASKGARRARHSRCASEPNLDLIFNVKDDVALSSPVDDEAVLSGAAARLDAIVESPSPSRTSSISRETSASGTPSGCLSP